MCRISGIISNQDSQESIINNVKAMCTAMAHGGPDGEGIEDLGINGVVFGHRRLALLDLTEAGHQPMADLQNRYLLTFNGEIYNYLELKAELSNYPFKTGTDTEVIVAGFAKWGTSLFPKLRGMFAFALLDKEENATYLVRDPSGIKPLYYSKTVGRVVFASEVRAFRATTFHFKEDKNWKVYFLAFGHIPEPFTILDEVKSLPKGHYLRFELNTRESTIQLYHSEISTRSIISNSSKAEKMVADQLNNAVQHHLLADAKIGVFLSGGIDSSILTLVADQKLGSRLDTISINFDEAGFSEKIFQDVIVDKLSGHHSTHLVTNEEFEANFDTIVAAIDQPSNDCINSWFVSKYAKERGLKAVLSGIGADEIFGGYPSFKKMGIVNKLQKLPKMLLRMSTFVPSLRVKRLYYLSYKNTIGKYLFLRGFFSPMSISRLLDIPVEKVNDLLEHFPIQNLQSDQVTNGEEASWIETNLYMQNQLLRDTDVMSMSHGIEVRIPYLDQDFLNIVEQISADIKYDDDLPKKLLIDSFKESLPEQIWNRPKMGFTFPLADWLKGNKRITDVSRYRNQYAKTLINRFKNGNLHWSKAFALFQVFNGD